MWVSILSSLHTHMHTFIKQRRKSNTRLIRFCYCNSRFAQWVGRLSSKQEDTESDYRAEVLLILNHLLRRWPFVAETDLWPHCVSSKKDNTYFTKKTKWHKYIEALFFKTLTQMTEKALIHFKTKINKPFQALLNCTCTHLSHVCVWTLGAWRSMSCCVGCNTPQCWGSWVHLGRPPHRDGHRGQLRQTAVCVHSWWRPASTCPDADSTARCW